MDRRLLSFSVMKTGAVLLTLLSASVAAACSSASEPEPVGRAKDRVIIDAPATTRQAIGIASWGIADGDGSTIVHGYDASNTERITFEYRATQGSAATFEATLDVGKTHVALNVEAPDDMHVRVIENSFHENEVAKAVLARIVADLRSQPAKSASTTLATTDLASLRPLDGDLTNGNSNVVNTCQARLVPSSANAGQTANDCGNDPSSVDCNIGVNGAQSPGDAENQCCSSASNTAENYLNRNASELANSGDLPMDKGVSPNVDCANFVSAVLQQSGLIDWHTNSVGDLKGRLEAQGWREVPASQARPGDVAIIDGNQHTELVNSNDNGRVGLIGSNNVNADGSQRITKQAPYSANTIYLTPPGSQCT